MPGYDGSRRGRRRTTYWKPTTNCMHHESFGQGERVPAGVHRVIGGLVVYLILQCSLAHGLRQRQYYEIDPSLCPAPHCVAHAHTRPELHAERLPDENEQRPLSCACRGALVVV